MMKALTSWEIRGDTPVVARTMSADAMELDNTDNATVFSTPSNCGTVSLVLPRSARELTRRERLACRNGVSGAIGCREMSARK